MNEERLYGFDAIVPKHAKVLILGSMPSDVSLQKREYYGFPHNRFWKIMAKFSGRELTTYEAKLKLLDTYGIALWDVVHSCTRIGSLDHKIKDVQVNRIDALLESNKEIVCILCNGKKAYTLFIKYFPQYLFMCKCMGSTSNANRSIAEETLINDWLEKLEDNVGKSLNR